MTKRTEYFAVDSDGYLLSTLSLTDAEVSLYGATITSVRPPDRPADEPQAPDPWVRVRTGRNRRLAASDWTMLTDVPMPEERRQQWQTYRQALRDITSQPDPFNIVWPVPPA